MNKAIFLDRDGVINKPVIVDGKPYPPDSLANLEIIEGVKSGIALLRKEGFKVFVVTNQPDVARGKTPKTAVQEIHHYLAAELDIDEIVACYHDGADNCNCRKPLPGMILGLAEKWNIDLSASFMIGDRWRDIQAAKNAGIRSVLIDYGYDEQYEEPDFKCRSFTDAVNYILNYKPLQ